MANIALVYDDLFLEHHCSYHHPECPERLPAIRRELGRRGIDGRLTVLVPRDATRTEIERVHRPEHYEKVANSSGASGNFDPDTYYSPKSFAAACRAAGGVLAATEEVLAGRFDSAFCLVRPPGHHAEADRSMGFCLFNNVAVAAAHALEKMGLERILIVDSDLHHGNGTQHIFESSNSVFYFSTHRFPYYPGTGHYTETGTGEGSGYTCNCPLPPGLGDADYDRLFEDILLPLAVAYRPDLLLVSAGFDTYENDPLCGMNITEGGFASLADRLLSLDLPTVFTLEGGYDIEGQARCTATVIERQLVRAGEEIPEPPPPAYAAAHPKLDRLIEAIRDVLAPIWPEP